MKTSREISPQKKKDSNKTYIRHENKYYFPPPVAVALADEFVVLSSARSS